MADEDYQRSPFLVPPLPEEVIRNAETTGSRSGGSNENLVEAPERTAVRSRVDTLEADHQKAMDAKLTHDQAVAHIDQENKNAAVDLADQQQKARDAAYKATQPGINDWTNRLRESWDRYDKAPAVKLFTTGSGIAENLPKAVGLALAGIGDAITTRALITAGHAPTGKNSVADIIERDLAQQRANIAGLHDKLVEARTGFQDAQQGRAQLLAEVDQRGAIAFKRANLLAASRLASAGADQAKIDAILDQLGFRQKTEEMRQASVAPLINHVTTNHQEEGGTEYSHTTNVNKPPPGSQARPANVNDFEGKPVGQAPAGEAEAVNKDTLLRKKAIESLESLRDANKNGTRHLPTDEDYQPYKSLFEDAGIQMAAISPLGKTDSSTKHEFATLGPNGQGVFSADPKIFDRLIAKIKRDAESSWKIHNSRPSDQEIAQVRATPSRMEPPTPPAKTTGVPTAAPTKIESPAPAASPVPAKPQSPRDRAIQLLRTTPAYGNRGKLMQSFSPPITDAELNQ